MADRLEFDVGFDLTAAERQAIAFEKRFDKPIQIRVEIDQKDIERKFQALNARLARAANIQYSIDLDAGSLNEKVALAAREAEAKAPKITLQADVDKDSIAALSDLLPDLSGGAKGLSGGLEAVTTGVEGLQSATGPAAQSVQGLTSSIGGGGPIALIAAASAAYVGLGFAVSALPAVMFAAGGAVSALGGALGAFGVTAAIELAPVRDALAGITSEAPRLAETFGRELTNIKGIFAEAFGPLVGTVQRAFEPVNEFLSGFLAEIAPSINRLADALLPVISQLADSFAGPLGSSLGNIIDQFSKLAVQVLPKLFDDRLIRFFDQIGVAIEKSGPGVEEFINAFLDIIDVIATELPDLIELGNQLAPILSTLANALSAFLNNVEAGLQPLAVLVSVVNTVGDQFGLMGSPLNTAHTEMSSTDEESKKLADSLKKAGERAAKFGADVEGLVKIIADLTGKQLNRLPGQVLDTSQAIAQLDEQFASGKITAAQLNQQLLLLRSNTTLSDEAFAQAASAFGEFKTAADTVNTALGSTVQFTRLAADQQFFFLAALDDGKLTADEFAAVMRTANLTSQETAAVFEQLTARTAGFRDALFGLIPTAQSAFDAIDLGAVKLGFKLGALIEEFRKQQSDTFVFFANLDKIIAAGRPDLARLIIGSGLDKQTQEALAAEGALGGQAILDGLEQKVGQLNVNTEVLKGKAETIAKQLGVELPAAFKKFVGEDALAAPEVKVDAKDAEEKLTAVGKQLGDLDDRSATVDLLAHDELGPVISTLNQSLNALDDRSVTVTIGADDQLTASIVRLNQALDQLDGRTITVDLIAQLVNNAREHGGPVWPGPRFTVNEAGTEGILDRSGFRKLPAGRRTMTFDRPGVIIPADQVNAAAAMAAPAGSSSSTSTVTHQRSTVTNAPTIIVQGAGHHPMAVARRVARYLP